MKILAIDTSGTAVSAAVAENGGLLSYQWLRHGKTHAEALTACIEAALAGPDMKLNDCGAFAVICGPGSFTGLRIGVATVKAFAYANKTGVIGIPTLDALARNLTDTAAAQRCEETLLCPVMDARNGNVYQAIFQIRANGGKYDGTAASDGTAPPDCSGSTVGSDPDGQIISTRNKMTGAFPLANTALISAGGAADRLKEAIADNKQVKRVIFNGDAAPEYIDFFRKELDGYSCIAVYGPALYQNAASAALLACEAVKNGMPASPAEISPEYHNAGYTAAGRSYGLS